MMTDLSCGAYLVTIYPGGNGEPGPALYCEGFASNNAHHAITDAVADARADARVMARVTTRWQTLIVTWDGDDEPVELVRQRVDLGDGED